MTLWCPVLSLQWRHNGRDSVSNHQPHDCLLSRLFRRRSKKTSKLRVTGLCAVNSPVTGDFPAQMASNAENVSIWWRHHVVFHLVNMWFICPDYSDSFHCYLIALVSVKWLPTAKSRQVSKPRSREISVIMIISLYRHLASASAGVLVKFESDWKSLNLNLAAFRHVKVLR